MSPLDPPPVRLSFDRGTVVLSGIDHSLARSLPGVLWDSRTRQYRAPAWRYRELLAALRESGSRGRLGSPGRRGAPDGARLIVVDEIAKNLERTNQIWNEVELRSYQKAALTAWQLAEGRGIVVLPTGSGKTRLAVAAIRSIAPQRTLCLVPTRVLLHQWVAELSQWYRGKIGCWGDGRRQTEAITVATFESGLRHAAKIGASFGFVVIDEVHHFGDRIKDEALEMCVAPMRLGLTATPPEDPIQLERLLELVGPVQFQLSIADLTGTYLASYDVVVLSASLNDEELARYRAEHAVFARVFRAFRRSSPTGSWNEFVAVASRSDEGRRALAAWRRSKQIEAFPQAKRALLAELLERHRGGRVLVFTPDNASTYEVAREHFVMPLTCDIKRKEREEVLERFRRGELRALVSSRVLNEGLDVPDADVAIIVGGALGLREHVQRVGRLLRPAPGKRATVYELVASGTSETWSSLRRRKALVTRTTATA